jgi:hypothetical protein
MQALSPWKQGQNKKDVKHDKLLPFVNWSGS